MVWISMGNDFWRLKLIFGCGFYHGRYEENFAVDEFLRRIWVFQKNDWLKLGEDDFWDFFV
jgi:hypothetical protein